MDLITPLRPDPWLLGAAVALDLAIGDPVYPYHPVRLIGATLTGFENALRRIGWDGYGGGIALLFLLATIWIGGTAAVLQVPNTIAAQGIHFFLLYSLLALGDLLRHGSDVDQAAERGDVAAARIAIAKLVGRDTAPMDANACVRAAIESVSENLTDGFISPVFWYALGGMPGLVLFKVVSTMDSMVGYKNARYLRFGWCGARTDDLMNLVPARLTYLLLAVVAFFVPGCSTAKALRIGWQQHALVPGPNSGWSEATAAGALQRRLIGPIWNSGQLVTELWLGDPADPPAGTVGDFQRASILLAATGLVAVGIAIRALVWY